MSSSSASTRSHRSAPSSQPSWRTSQRQRASIAVSAVSALPEAGAPLRSALDQLPNIATSTLDSRGSTLQRDDPGTPRSVDSAIAGMQESPLEDEHHDDQPTVGSSDHAPDMPAGGALFPANPPPMIDVEESSPAVRIELPQGPDAPLPPREVSRERGQSSSHSLTPKPSSSNLVERIVSPPSSSSRLSWFGSFGWSKDDQLSVSPTAEDDPSSALSHSASIWTQNRTATSAPAVSTAQLSLGTATSSATTTQSAPVPFPTSASGSCTPKPSPLKPAALDRVLSQRSVVSVDDEVPRPRIELPASPTTAHSRRPSKGEVVRKEEEERESGKTLSVTTLNPSTSRFSLKIPLLGRTKVPLDQAIAGVGMSTSAKDSGGEEALANGASSPVAPGKDTAVQPSVMSLAVAGGNVTTETAPSAAQELSFVAAADAQSQPTPTVPANSPVSAVSSTPAASLSATASLTSSQHGQSPDGRRTAGGSWWDYIPWSGAGGEPEGQAAPGIASIASPTALSMDAAAVPDASPPHAESEAEQAGTSDQPDAGAEAGEPAHTDAPAVPPPAGETEAARQPVSPTSPTSLTAPPSGNMQKTLAAKPSSILSVRSGGSAWLSPWSWYYGSTSGNVPQAQNQEGEVERAKTESELVKESALARDDEQPPLASDQHNEAQPSTREASPVAQPPSPGRPEFGAPRPSAPAATQTTGTATHDTHVQNPLETSVVAQRSGWASFFTSRALLTKSLSEGEQKPHAEMEVMDVPEDEGAETSQGGENIEAKSGPITIVKDEGKDKVKKRPSRSAAASPKSLSSLTRVERLRTESAPTPPTVRDGGKGDRKDKEGNKKGTKPDTRAVSPAPSATSTKPPPLPNLVLPGFKETFHSPPRSNVPPAPRKESARGRLGRTLSLVGGALGLKEQGKGKGKGKEIEQSKERDFLLFGRELPKALDALGEQLDSYLLNGGCRVVVIGVAGWTPGPVIRTIAGGLPSSSSKFVDYTCGALERFEQEHGFKFKKITTMPLEGDGMIEQKVNSVHHHLLSNEDWMEDLHAADVVFVATHSQGSIVSTHLIDRLIRDGHILTSRSVHTLARTAAAIAPGGAASIQATQAQRICFLALCGVHLGPLRYLKTSTFLQPYIQYFENAAASELFEFQNTDSAVSKSYIKALSNMLDHGAKVVYIASLNDQVVPIYSGIFSAASHPHILRALYIDGDAYSTSDFLTNLLILLVRIMNAGLSDGGLLNHLSEATAGSLNGVGHSTVYDEPETYNLAVKYFFLTNDGDTSSPASLSVQQFDAVVEQNDYEIPWSLRDMIADERVAYFFAQEFAHLRDSFDDWQPKSSIMRDIKRKLQPIQRLSSIASHTASKL